jgi:hypothetical protein
MKYIIYFLCSLPIFFIVIFVFGIFESLLKKDKKIMENEITDEDRILVKGLIESDMLNFYMVSLISSDNEDTKEVWSENKIRVIKLKKCIEEMQIVNKKHILKQIDECLLILNRELGKYA